MASDISSVGEIQSGDTIPPFVVDVGAEEVARIVASRSAEHDLEQLLNDNPKLARTVRVATQVITMLCFELLAIKKPKN